MDVEADRAELRRLWLKEYQDDDPEIDPAAGIDPEGDIEDRWNDAGRLSELLSGLFEDGDPLIRLRATQVALAYARSPAPPDEAMRALEEIAALPDSVGRIDGELGFWSYPVVARETLATQARCAEVDRSDALAIADVLESVWQQAGSFFELETERTVETPPETRELASALRDLASGSDGDVTGRVEIPWLLAINVLRIFSALAHDNFLTGSDLGWSGAENADAKRLGDLLYEALKPTREELGYDPVVFILWPSGWEILG